MVTAGAAMTNLPARDLDEVVAGTGEVWKALRGARVFVTGGSGFVGRWLLETALWADAQLDLGLRTTVLTRNPQRFAEGAPHLAGHRAISLLAGDARSFEFPRGEFSHVIHAASDPRPLRDAASRRAVFDTTVSGTARVLEFAAACGVRRLLFTSSGAVYGRQPPELSRLSEDYPGAPDPSQPASAYAEAKRAAETLCALHADAGLEPVIARLFAFIGPYLPLDAQFAAGNFVRDALRGGPVRILGDGTPYRSYLYAADLAAWLWTLLVRGKACRAYNVGSSEPLTILELAERVARAAGRDVRIEVGQKAEPGAAAERYVPATRRAAEELGLRPTVSVDEAIRRTLAWHRGGGTA